MPPQKKKTLAEINNESRKTMKLRSPAIRRAPNGYSPPISPVKRLSKPSTTVSKLSSALPPSPPTVPPSTLHLVPSAVPPITIPPIPPAAIPPVPPAASPELNPVPIPPSAIPPSPPTVNQSPRPVRRSLRHSKCLPRHREVQCHQPLNPSPSAASSPVRPVSPVRAASPVMPTSPIHIEPQFYPPSPPPLSSVNSQVPTSQGHASFNSDEIDIDVEFPILKDPRSIR